MTSDCSLISELASAKDNIRRKYLMLKQDDADTQSHKHLSPSLIH